MDSIISLVGDGYVISAADTNNARSVLVMKDDLDKVMHLDPFKLLSIAGEPGDAVYFTEYIQKNVHLYALKIGIPLTTHAVANYTRGELAKFLRRSPYSVNMILGGYDEGTGPSLYYMDYLGTMHKLQYTAQGYASFFVLSTLDRFWRKGMSEADGLEVIKKCIAEVKQRFLINQPKFTIKIVDKNGIRILDTEA